jgi:hypothetical protein
MCALSPLLDTTYKTLFDPVQLLSGFSTTKFSVTLKQVPPGGAELSKVATWLLKIENACTNA